MNAEIENNLTDSHEMIETIREMAILADAKQYEPPVYGLRRGETESRSGQPNDPTGDLAACPERLHLVKVLRETEQNSTKLKMALGLMQKQLTTALEPYKDNQ